MALNFAHLLFNFAHEYYGCIFIISHAVFYLFRVETFLVLFSTRGKTICVKGANSEMGTMAYHLQLSQEASFPPRRSRSPGAQEIGPKGIPVFDSILI